jgi:glycosyltransferase involved in cell wall biosynthesis
MDAYMNMAIFCAGVGFGGSQNTAAAMAVALAEKGHTITLYVDESRFRCHGRLNGCRIVDVPMSRFQPAVMANVTVGNLVRTVQAVRTRKHDALLSISYVPLPLCILAGTLLDIPCLLYETAHAPARIRRFVPGDIATVSEENQMRLSELLGVTPNAIGVVRGRLDMRLFDSYSNPLSPETPKPRVDIVMLSRMRGEKTRGILLAIDTVKQLYLRGHAVRLMIYGEGRDLYRVRQHAQRVNQELHADTVVLAGTTDAPWQVFSQCDIALGVGRSAWEAMACGKPTVVMGQEGFSGWVCPDSLETLMRHNFTARGLSLSSDPGEIAALLTPLCESEQTRKDVGRYGLKVVREHYDVKRGAVQLESLIGKLVAKGPSNRIHGDAVCTLGVLSTLIMLYAKSIALWCVKPRLSLSVWHEVMD